jgi:hypothetical protein
VMKSNLDEMKEVAKTLNFLTELYYVCIVLACY